MGEFGAKFRKAREKKDISLDDVSNVTKISARMLQAIEDEHFDLLPGGVFNKGFIRAYAKHLGLNDEEAVTDYLACLRQAQIDAHEVREPQRPRNGTPPPRPAMPEKRPVEASAPVTKSSTLPPVEELPDLQLPRAEHVRPGKKDFADSPSGDIPWKILALAAVVIVLGILLWTRRSHNTNTAAGSAPDTVQAKNAPSPGPPPATQPSTAALASSTPPSTPASTSGSQPVIHPPAANPAPSPATNTKVDQKNNEDERNDVTVRTLSNTKPKVAETPAVPLKLVIRATETSWISVLADGQTVSQETLIAPAHASIRANREIVARIGNAAGVTFLWNGQEIPADGAEAEVKTFVFDGNGMRVVPTAQAPGQNQ